MVEKEGKQPKSQLFSTSQQAKQKGKKMDVKDLGVVDNKNETSGSAKSLLEDSFQRMYSKELDLDEDEVPVILHELNDSAVFFISREQYERSLSLLQKAQTLLDRLQFQKNPKDRFLVQITMHNMALCFQKLGALEECALCLDACLHQINSQYLLPRFTGTPSRKLKKLKYECKIHMQLCALLSQLHKHQEALYHAKRAVQISQYLLTDFKSLSKIYYYKAIKAKRKEQLVHDQQQAENLSDNSHQDLIYYNDEISMLERTAFRVYPIIREICSKLVGNKQQEQSDDSDTSNHSADSLENLQINMKVLLGYLNQSEWLYLFNIGNIMQITPLSISDLYSELQIDVEFGRDSILEKISYLAISYFCVSTELRFLITNKDKLQINVAQVKTESEFWHGKSIEIACGYLPSESPLVTHILQSYQKHHAPVSQSIPEGKPAENHDVKIVRPVKGIEKCQYQPIIRNNFNLQIVLSPISISPNNYKSPKPIQQQASKDLILIQPQKVLTAKPIVEETKKDEDISIDLQINKSQDQIKAEKLPLTPTPGSGEQNTKGDDNSQNTTFSNNLPSSQSGSRERKQRMYEISESIDAAVRKPIITQNQRPSSKTKPKKEKKSSTGSQTPTPQPPQIFSQNPNPQHGMFEVKRQLGGAKMSAPTTMVSTTQPSVKVTARINEVIPQDFNLIRPSSGYQKRPNDSRGSKRQLEQRATSAGKRPSSNARNERIQNFKTVASMNSQKRVQTPQTNSASPRKTKSNSQLVLKPPQVLGSQNLGMLLLNQSLTQDLIKKKPTEIMNKSGGFKKQQSNILKNYFSEAKLLANPKIVDDKRTKIFSQAVDSLVKSQSVTESSLERKQTNEVKPQNYNKLLNQMYQQVANKEQKNSQLIRRFIQERQLVDRSPTPPLIDNYTFENVPPVANPKKYIRGRKIEFQKEPLQREPTPVFVMSKQSSQDNIYQLRNKPHTPSIGVQKVKKSKIKQLN